MRLFSNLRQLIYPVEFRIREPIWPTEILSNFEKIIKIMESDKKSKSEGLSMESIIDQFQFLGDVGTGLWRLKKKMVQPGTELPLEEMRKAYRHLESVWDALKEAGIEILDHTDTPYAPGMSLKVVAFQPLKGIDREMVIETIKPSTYYKNVMLQMGEVIVGTFETT